MFLDRSRSEELERALVLFSPYHDLLAVYDVKALLRRLATEAATVDGVPFMLSDLIKLDLSSFMFFLTVNTLYLHA